VEGKGNFAIPPSTHTLDAPAAVNLGAAFLPNHARQGGGGGRGREGQGGGGRGREGQGIAFNSALLMERGFQSIRYARSDVRRPPDEGE